MSNFIYQPSEDSDFLMHHGIKGQKWGVENGPPYPLNRKDYSPAEQRANAKEIAKANTKHGYVTPVYWMKRGLGDRVQKERKYLYRIESLNNAAIYLDQKYGKDYYKHIKDEVQNIVGEYGNIKVKNSAIAEAYDRLNTKGLTDVSQIAERAINDMIYYMNNK